MRSLGSETARYPRGEVQGNEPAERTTLHRLCNNYKGDTLPGTIEYAVRVARLLCIGDKGGRISTTSTARNRSTAKHSRGQNKNLGVSDGTT